MYNQINNKLTSLNYTGIALVGFAAANAFMLVLNKLIPMLDGSFRAEMLPGVEGAVLTGVMALFGVVMGAFGLSYLLMALLGINAIRFSKNPEGVKIRTGLAKFLVVSGVASLAFTALFLTEGTTFTEALQLMLPEAATLSFIVSYLVETKEIKETRKVMYA